VARAEINEATGTRAVRQRLKSGEHSPVRQYGFLPRLPRYKRPFNRDAHGASRKVNGLLSSAPASDKVWCANGLIEAHRLSSETAKNIRLTGGSCRLVSPKVFFGAHNVLPHGQPLGRAARRLR